MPGRAGRAGAWGGSWIGLIGVTVLLAVAVAAVGAPRPCAAAVAGTAAKKLKDLSLDELRRRLAALEAEASAALAEEDYERAARLRREMVPLEEEIVRRERETTPSRPPDFRVPRR